MRGTIRGLCFCAGVCAGLVGFGFSSGRAATISLVSSKDNTLYSSTTGGRSNGAGDHLFAGVTAQGGIRRGLVAFNVSSVPAGSVVNSATLTLHMSRTVTPAMPIGLHRVLADWGEGASNANNEEGTGASSQPGDATWRHRFFNTTFWSTDGGDFAAGASATTSVGDIEFYSWSSAQVIADVQQWVDNSAGNFGWLLRSDESFQGTTKRFDTKENPIAEHRPSLTIDYTPVPEPTGIAIVLGAFVSSRRGRR